MVRLDVRQNVIIVAINLKMQIHCHINHPFGGLCDDLSGHFFSFLRKDAVIVMVVSIST